MHNRKLRIKEIVVSVAIERDGDCFHAFAPALRGLHVEGVTEEEALNNAEKAIDVYLDSIYRENEQLPVGQYLSVKCEPITQRSRVPAVHLRNVTVRWPIQRMSGAR